MVGTIYVDKRVHWAVRNTVNDWFLLRLKWYYDWMVIFWGKSIMLLS